jgi:hypothetical protein
MTVRPDSVTGAGNFTVPAPESLESLNATVDGSFTPEESAAQMTVDATLAESSAPGLSANTTGEMVVAPDSFDFATDYELSYANTGTGFDRPETYNNYTVEETDSGYDVSIAERRTIYEWSRDRWNTSDSARQAVTEQYQSLAEQYGGSAEVTIETYNYTTTEGDDPDILELSYSVTLTGVEDGVAEEAVDSLAESESVDLSAEERAELEESLTNVTIDRAAFSMVRSSDGMEGSVDLRVTDYEQPLVDYLSVAAEDSEAINESQVDRAETTLAARSAADLRQTVTWSGDYTGDASTPRLEASVEYDAENWDDYTDELADRGMPIETDVTFDGYARKTGDQVEMNLTFQVAREDIVDSAIQDAVSSVGEMEGSEANDTTQALQALDEADLQVAKADLILGEERVEVRAAAQFENLSAFGDSVTEFPGGAQVNHIYGEQTGDGGATYVYVEDLGMSETELRDSELADDETVIHAAGTWSEEFPTMNLESTSEYLGTDIQVSYPPHSAEGSAQTGTATATATATATDTATATATSTDEPDDGGSADTATESGGSSVFGPGFGASTAAVAVLVGAALLVLRRRD